MVLSASIMGAGACGLSIAASLRKRGHKALVHSDLDHTKNIDDIEKQGYLEAKGDITGRYDIQTTTKIEDVFNFSKIIIIAINSDGHDNTFRNLKESRLDFSEHTIVTINANLASLIAREIKPK